MPSLSPDESDLLARCLEGAPKAWEEFLARYRGVLERAARATLLRVIGAVPEDDLEAVVEAALLAIVKDKYAALRSFAGRSSLAGYLQVITARIALNHLRGERRKGWLRFRPLESVSDAPVPKPAAPESPERLAALQRALEELPPRDRLILKLFHLDGAGYKEIASLLGLSLNAVSPALIRARQKIRALLGPDR
ncbi:MAG: RNA polymerase sigma factor [Planctomycetes bacterium]|nr:RNA polymerase sigma factor [Planctomycetota bacterium]